MQCLCGFCEEIQAPATERGQGITILVGNKNPGLSFVGEQFMSLVVCDKDAFRLLRPREQESRLGLVWIYLSLGFLLEPKWVRGGRKELVLRDLWILARDAGPGLPCRVTIK
jgi:hypothetical protein